MIVKAHTSIIGDTGYNCHSRNFFKALHKITPVQVRNYTVGSSWVGYDNDEPHNKEYYIDGVLKTMLVEQTLSTENGWSEFPLYQSYKNEGTPDIHIVLNDNRHHYFYENYPDGKSIAYNAWETTKQPDDFFENLKKFDQVWVPTQWQKDCTVEQGIPEWKVKVVPEGVDIKTYKPKNYVISKPVNRPFRFILVGRWDYRKSTKEIIETFVKTFSEDDNVELLINVDNPFAYDGMNSTEERLERYGIKHSGIKILHHLSKEEYVETLKSSDVFLSCARGEGWNLPLIEAMSCGIPSMYSNWGGQLEFAEGRGIPVNIIGEVPANVQGNDNYFSWTENAPGNFAEPDFNDLSKKMRDIVENYFVHKKKALDDSDEIREIFTWDNAAKIANEILQELMNEDSGFDDSVAIVLAHANTPHRKQLLKDCLSSIKMDTILSTNHTIDEETQKMADWVVYSKENPILLKDEFAKYDVSYFSWWKDENGETVTVPFEYEHGYAAYNLTELGIKYAKLLGKKRVHIINYDYVISPSTLKQNEKLLEENDIVLYTHEDWDVGHKAYCSAFFSANIDTAVSYFTKYKSKDEYYRSMNGFNILEINMFHHFESDVYRKHIQSVNSLKDINKINQEEAHNFYMFEPTEMIGKTFKQISDSVDCDKSTYHEYDRIYPIFLEKWRNESINIFEIGIEYGKSMKIWENYFPFANIWGMDIENTYNSPRCNVFIGDQSKIEDLRNISNKIPECELIVDDGSHVPEHQLKTFNHLFRNVLKPGGVYIIEDIECSYWRPDAQIYGYESGYLNIVDYFTKLNHSLNSHYNNYENELNIHSITFAPNCIIIVKNDEKNRLNKEYRFKNYLGELPDYKKKKELKSQNTININFIDGPFFEVVGSIKKEYTVKFIDGKTNEIIHQAKIQNNQWTRCSRKWYTDWIIRIEANDIEPFEYRYDASNKKVFIVFESSSLGDTIAWLPYVEEFRKKHKCNVAVSTFQNELFESQYPQIEFVKPGTTVHNLYALYRLGWFYDGDKTDYFMNKSDFKKIPLQQAGSDILGLDFEEIRPRIKSIEPMKSNKPYICIANHSTAQSKYWNNPTGWQELVDYVKGLGYDVYLLSKEEDGYMGNKNPNGVIKVDGKTLEEIGSILLGSKGFIGLGSGLSWFSWALNVPTILISGFSEPYQEMQSVHRIINESVCHGCFDRHTFDKGDWNWCPDHKGTERQFECTKSITFDMIKPKIDKILSI
jgi:autotransporter strand-loop-strand O-heptosyltransferase